MHADRHKNSDNNRIPEVNIQQSVKDTRTQMLLDASDTSIPMRIFQVLGKIIPVELIQQNMPTRDLAAKVEWGFVSSLRIAPGQQEQRKESELVESDYSAAWHEVDQEYNLLPGHFLSLSETKYAENDKSLQKIDAAFYPDEYQDEVVDGRPNWVRMGLPIEFKRGGTGLDPFDDRPGHNLEAEADKRKEVRGQVLSYAEHVFGDQHRTAVYMLFVNGPLFRVMLWDHSGVIVTEAIDYLHSVDGTICLLTFLNCYSKATLQTRGIDITAVPLPEGSCGWQRMNVVAEGSQHDLDYNEHVIEDVSKLHPAFVDPSPAAVCLGANDSILHQDPTVICPKHTTCHCSYPDVVPEFTHARQYFKDSLVEGYPRYMIKVGDLTLLVGRHMFKASGLIGRGTRGFVALDWQSQRLVFLKDAWRPHYDGMQEEGVILEKLNKAGVPNVPTVLAHGDVEGQETEASNYSPSTGPKKVLSIPAWPIRNDFQARARDMVRKSSKKALPATVAAPNGDYASVNALNAHASLATLSGPAGYPQCAILNPHLPSRDAGPSSEYVAHLTSSSAAGGDTSSTSKTPHDEEAPFVDDKVQSEAGTGAAGVKRPVEEMATCEPGAGLRHLIHFRIVMKDICLGAMAFKNSKQWVGIILDCLRAHAQAYDVCGYIHRDVSAGNILILPIIRRAGKTGSVYWQGILTDWELAKHKNVDFAREPDRTGTWHFMSLNLLSYPGEPVSIADELEAFVHVLIYGCVRFIPHNLNTIYGFMNSYFDGYTLDDGSTYKFACPPAKSASLTNGKLTNCTRLVKFFLDDGSTDHPLNPLIRTLLGLFKTRYQVLMWHKEHVPQTPQRRTAPSHATGSTKSLVSATDDRSLYDEWDNTMPASRGVSEDNDTMDVDDEAQSQESSEESAREEGDGEPRPNQEMERVAASLQLHKTIGQILTQYLKPNGKPQGLKKPVVWPANDKGPDRLVDYVGTDRAITVKTLQKPPKRQRTMADQPPANAEPSSSRTATKAAPPTRQRSARNIIPPSDRITRSKDGSLPGPASAGRGLPQTRRSTRATTSRGRGRGAVAATPVTRAASGSSRPAGSSAPVTAIRHSRSNGNVQNGSLRDGGSGSKGVKGKAPARR